MAKLLLVEDDNNLREIYEARLQAEGYNIVSAKDGEEALAVAKAEKPDLVIADVMMPKVSGFEMLDILRNTDGLKTVKVIMLTALSQSDDQQRADKLGADRYLVKSQVTLEDIVRVTHELLDDGSDAPATDNTVPATPPPVASDEPMSTTPSTPDPDPDPAPIPSTTPAEPTSPPAEPPKDSNNIEEFVAGATTEAPGPEATAPPASAVPPATTPSSAANSDDKLMADAVDSLMKEANGPGSEIKPDEPTVKPSPEIDVPPETPTPEGPTIAHKKVISPPDTDSQAKPNIQTLYAAEQAKDKASGDPPTPKEPTPPPGEQPPDPNSIAL